MTSPHANRANSKALLWYHVRPGFALALALIPLFILAVAVLLLGVSALARAIAFRMLFGPAWPFTVAGLSLLVLVLYLALRLTSILTYGRIQWSRSHTVATSPGDPPAGDHPAA